MTWLTLLREACLMVVVVFIVGAGIGTFDGSPFAYAYDAPGHFYTTAAVLHHLNSSPLNDDERQVIAFCAWLPDETRELNAVSVAWDASSLRLAGYPICSFERWSGLFGGCPTILPTSTGGPLVIVQQLLHGLTGGDSAAVTQVAGSLMMTFAGQVSMATANRPIDPNLLCALGFSIHLYGDSFAHRQLDDDSKMYETGMGHARDRHHPDHPCIARIREQAWDYYARAAGWAFDREWPWPLDAAMKQKLDYLAVSKNCVDASGSECVTRIAGVCVEWDDNDATLRKLLVALLPYRPQGWFTIPEHYVLGDACEAYLKQNLSRTKLTCHDTWKIYKPMAQQMFLGVKGAIKPDFVYPTDYYNSEPQWLQ